MALRQNQPPVVNRFAELNDPGDVFKNPTQLLFMRTLLDIVKRAFADFISMNTANPQFMLISPAGKIYKITIDDAGVLQSEYIRG